MSIEKGRWVDGRYVDGNGNELIPPTGMFNRVKKKDINEPDPKPEDLDQESFVELVYDLFIVLREKVFTIPVLTMIGVWIIVLYIIFS